MTNPHDGLYQVHDNRYGICAGFVIQDGQLALCAPILYKRFPYWWKRASQIEERKSCIISQDQ